MSHPIRPDKYIEVNNFYTMTVYQKGAEIIRMYHTLLGEEGFQKGMALYFQRHDHEAVTCDDFRAAMADANGLSLDRFGRWYGQSGTPELTVRGVYDNVARTFELSVSQRTPPTLGQPEKAPLVIPLAVGLLTADGRELSLQLAEEDEPVGPARVLLVAEAEQRFTFVNVAERPVPSLLRGFSAPVKLEYPYRPDELAVLMAHDRDAFVRWEAAQLLAQREILTNVERLAAGDGPSLGEHLPAAFAALLADRDSDPALIAEALSLPEEDYLAEQMELIDVDGIHAAREFVKAELAQALMGTWRQRYSELASDDPYDKSAASMGRRSLRNVCLSFLMQTEDGSRLAEEQLRVSDNMTDTLAALKGLVRAGAPEAAAALQDFEQHWREDSLVMDKWFVIQATVPGPGTVERVRTLMDHDAFSITNPNKVRSLLGAFATLNPTGFHAPDGSGYKLVADQVLALNALNPQVAARLAAAFNSWTRYDPLRCKLMKTELLRIRAADGLSPDVAEIVGNALAMAGGGNGL